jgi:hypothetical protein
MHVIAFLICALAALPAAALAAAPAHPVMPGWDACKWNDLQHQTPKYAIGRIMAAFPPSPNGLAAIAPAINVLYPGTKLVDSTGMDKISIPCVGVIDMVVNSGGKRNPDSGDSWAWQVVEDKCRACKPNKCEEVSKSKKCRAETAAKPAAKSGRGGSVFGARPGGGSGGGASGGGGRTAAGNGGGGRNHPDRSDVVAQAKDDLENAGHDLSGPCGAFSIVKLAAWRMGGGAGLLSKPSGNNCEGYSTDIIVYPDGRIYDVLVDGGGRNGPAWGDAGVVDPARYRPAADPGQP